MAIIRIRETMKNIYVLMIKVIAFLSVSIPLKNVAAHQTGPIGVFNQIPTHMFFLTPRPHAPRPLPEKSVYTSLSVDYFSIYSNASSSNHRILMDMEAVVLDARLAYGLTDTFSLGMRLPAVSMWDGVMDEALENYHTFLGLPNYGKEKSPENVFTYIIRKDGRAWFDSKKGGLNPTDMTLSAELFLADFKKTIPTQVGLTCEVKLPTGDSSRGFGSGAFDYGFFLPVQFSFSRFNTYLMPGYIRIGTPEFKNVNLSVRDIKSLFIGGEYIVHTDLSALVQISSYTSPFVDTGLIKLDTFSAELAVGMRYSLTNKMSIELAFCEDLTRTSPDFTLHLSVAYTIP